MNISVNKIPIAQVVLSCSFIYAVMTQSAVCIVAEFIHNTFNAAVDLRTNSLLLNSDNMGNRISNKGMFNYFRINYCGDWDHHKNGIKL